MGRIVEIYIDPRIDDRISELYLQKGADGKRVYTIEQIAKMLRLEFNNQRINAANLYRRINVLGIMQKELKSAINDFIVQKSVKLTQENELLINKIEILAEINENTSNLTKKIIKKIEDKIDDGSEIPMKELVMALDTLLSIRIDTVKLIPEPKETNDENQFSALQSVLESYNPDNALIIKSDFVPRTPDAKQEELQFG